MQPSPITSDQRSKIIRAAIYVGISAIVSYFISAITSNPDLFGPLTPIVNIVLVTVKQVFTKG